MKRIWFPVMLVLLALGSTLGAQTGPSGTAPAEPSATANTSALPRRVEAYYRNLFALGSHVQVNVSAPQPSTIPGLMQVTVGLSDGRSSNSETALVSADGRYLVRGEIRDTTVDPYAETRAAIKLADQPARGPADSPVTIVLYSDFQCPYCRQMYTTIETQVLKKHPEIRLVYKDFPLIQIHPWAMTAAIAAQCAYVQSNTAFWQLYANLYQYQNEITTENIQQRLEGYATAAGLDLARFKACMAKNEVSPRLQETLKETQTLGINSTPTLFINGRRLVGNVPEAVLEKVIAFELQQHAPPAQARPHREH